MPTLEVTKAAHPGFHSRWTRPVVSDSSEAHILLFTDVESLESAKEKLAADESVTAVDYQGMRSAKKNANAVDNRQLFLKFDAPKEDAEVKELDENIVSTTFTHNNRM